MTGKHRDWYQIVANYLFNEIEQMHLPNYNLITLACVALYYAAIAIYM